MKIRANIAENLKKRMQEQGKTLSELSEEFDIPLSSMKNYRNGAANLRADTIELLAERFGLTPAELISSQPDGWAQAKSTLKVAQLFATLSADRRAEGIELFLRLVDLFAEAAGTDG